MFRVSWKRARLTTWALLATMVLPLLLTGCGGVDRASVPPPVDDSGYPRSAGHSQPYGSQLGAPVAQPGMSKTVILAGAAALYYLYKQHQNKAVQGPEGQYYLSKNGRVYYRDAEHRAHWVTPPPQGIRVPEREARGLESFQGYDNRAGGRDLSNLPEGRI